MGKKQIWQDKSYGNSRVRLKPAKIREGFTLIELLIVITILAILASLVFVALKPLQRFEDTRNTKRWADVNAIIAAIKLYQVDHGGVFPDNITGLTNDLYYQIGDGDSCNNVCTGASGDIVLQGECLDLEQLIDDKYLADIPIDPSYEDASEDGTRYYFAKRTGGMITVGACNEEQGSNAVAPEISITR